MRHLHLLNGSIPWVEWHGFPTLPLLSVQCMECKSPQHQHQASRSRAPDAPKGTLWEGIAPLPLLLSRVAWVMCAHTSGLRRSCACTPYPAEGFPPQARRTLPPFLSHSPACAPDHDAQESVLRDVRHEQWAKPAWLSLGVRSSLGRSSACPPDLTNTKVCRSLTVALVITKVECKSGAKQPSCI